MISRLYLDQCQADLPPEMFKLVIEIDSIRKHSFYSAAIVRFLTAGTLGMRFRPHASDYTAFGRLPPVLPADLSRILLRSPSFRPKSICLDLGNTHDEDLATLCETSGPAPPCCSTLEEMFIFDALITDASAKLWIEFTHLKILHIQKSSNITHASYVGISHLPRLESLFLTGEDSEMESWEFLMIFLAPAALPELRTLILTNLPLYFRHRPSPEDYYDLFSLRSNPEKLEDIAMPLRRENFSEEIVAKFRKICPNLWLPGDPSRTEMHSTAFTPQSQPPFPELLTINSTESVSELVQQFEAEGNHKIQFLLAERMLGSQEFEFFLTKSSLVSVKLEADAGTAGGVDQDHLALICRNLPLLNNLHLRVPNTEISDLNIFEHQVLSSIDISFSSPPQLPTTLTVTSQTFPNLRSCFLVGPLLTVRVSKAAMFEALSVRTCHWLDIEIHDCRLLWVVFVEYSTVRRLRLTETPSLLRLQLDMTNLESLVSPEDNFIVEKFSPKLVLYATASAGFVALISKHPELQERIFQYNEGRRVGPPARGGRGSRRGLPVPPRSGRGGGRRGAFGVAADAPPPIQLPTLPARGSSTLSDSRGGSPVPEDQGGGGSGSWSSSM